MTPKQRIRSQPCGARFFRIDLHIHSFGGSHDVSDQNMTPENIIATSVDENVDIIAVTDHNSIGNVKQLQEKAGSTLEVIPGVELSTPEGHLLVYFRSYKDLDNYFSKLEIIDSDSAESRCQTSMLDCLKRIDYPNGFAILAHIDSLAGLEQKVPGYPLHKTDILHQRSLLGFEVTSSNCPIYYSDNDSEQQRVDIAKNRISRLGLASEQNLARVLFSDSHSLSALGRNAAGDKRITRAKMDSPSFEGLRLALQDSDARIRLEDDIPINIPHIIGIELEGGFLDSTTLHLSRNLNCIIGGRGAGKSTALEAIRVISQQQSNSSLIDSEVWPLNINIVWQDESKQLHTIGRRISENVINLDDPDFGPEFFPIECHGQGETAETSKIARKDPRALLDYLDKFTNVDHLIQQENEIRDQLLENQAALEEADRKLIQIPTYERALATAKNQNNALAKTNAHEILKLENQIAQERTFRSEVEVTISQIVGSLKDDEYKEIIEGFKEAKSSVEIKLGQEHFKKIQKVIDRMVSELDQASVSNHTQADQFEKEVSELITSWKAVEKESLDKIENKRKELEAQGVKLDIKFIRKLSKDLAEHQKTLNELKRLKKSRTDLYTKRKKLLKERINVRDRIGAAREAFGKDASKTLRTSFSDFNISVKYKCNAFSPEGETIITNAMEWRTVQVPRAAALAKELTVPRLLEAISKKDSEALKALKTENGEKVFSPEEAKKVIDTLSQTANKYALERCAIHDLPRITVTKKVQLDDTEERSVTKDFGKLSLGQQQSVLLALMLASDSNSPLIIDQPEDNLDGEFIYLSLVKALRRAKERRQVIIVTHNANIAVLGDAEQIVALKSASDKGRVIAAGSIDNKKARDAACSILEGTEEAFRR